MPAIHASKTPYLSHRNLPRYFQLLNPHLVNTITPVWTPDVTLDHTTDITNQWIIKKKNCVLSLQHKNRGWHFCRFVKPIPVEWTPEPKMWTPLYSGHQVIHTQILTHWLSSMFSTYEVQYCHCPQSTFGPNGDYWGVHATMAPLQSFFWSTTPTCIIVGKK